MKYHAILSDKGNEVDRLNASNLAALNRLITHKINHRDWIWGVGDTLTIHGPEEDTRDYSKAQPD